MRAQESNKRAVRYRDIINTDLYAPHDVLQQFPKYLSKMGVFFRLPILEWSETDVFEFLNGEQNPLYAQGCKRVGCFPCLASGDASKYHDFNLDEFGRSQKVLVMSLEKQINKSIWTSKSFSMKNNEKQDDLFNGCAFCAI